MWQRFPLPVSSGALPFPVVRKRLLASTREIDFVVTVHKILVAVLDSGFQWTKVAVSLHEK